MKLIMNEEIILGNDKLKAIDINTHRPGVNIYVDFMHINRFQPLEEFAVHAHENIEFHYIADGEGEVGFLKSGTNNLNMVQLPAKVKSARKPLLKEYRLLHDMEDQGQYIVYKLKKGDAFLNPPGQLHWQRSSQDSPLVEYALRFSFEEIPEDESAGKYFKKENSIINKLLNQDIIQVTEENDEVRRIFDSVFLEAYCEMPGYITKIKNEIYNLIIVIARSIWNKRKLKYFVPGVDIDKRRLRLIEDYVNANLSSTIRIEDLARNTYMSQRSLSRFVKQSKGVSVHKYIVQIRVNKAVDYLSNTDMTLAEIAVLTGFSSAYHLSSTIKKYIGKNPSEL